MLSKLTQLLYKPSDPSIVAIYRIIFGLFMVYQMLYYFNIDYTYQFMYGPEMLFHYEGLSFLKPLPLGILQLIHVLLLISSVCITIGWQYRKAMVFFFLGFTYFTFVDKTLYNNHLYLMALISFVMIFINADAKYSIKARRASTGLRKSIPAWNQYLLIFLISLPYFFGGIAKLGYNWLETNLVAEIVAANASSLLTTTLSDSVLIPLITYGGLIYDLGIVWLLLYKRTRLVAVIFVIVFNFMNNSVLFDDIGIFPFFMICSTLLFFNSERIGAWLDRKLHTPVKQPKLSKKQAKRLSKEQKRKHATSEYSEISATPSTPTNYRMNTLGTVLLVVFVIFQLVFPLRHYALTTNPEWYGVGMYFSWRMKMQTKKIEKMDVQLFDTETQDFGPVEVNTFLSKNQFLHLLDDPDNLVLLAKYLVPKAKREYNISEPGIKADIVVQFNGLPAQQMIVPSVDLFEVEAGNISDRSWIVPLQ